MGNIKAKNSLKLESSANHCGDIEAPSITIEEGAVMNGRIKMGEAEKTESISMKGDWLSVNQLAEYLEVDRSKVGEWALDGVIPGTKDGSEWRFERSKIDRWIAEGKVKTKG